MAKHQVARRMGVASPAKQSQELTLEELLAPMTDKIRDQAALMISKERVQMLLSQDETVFFSFLAMNLLPKEEQASITAATDGSHLYYNPQFIVTLTQPELRGLLCHEVMHPALSHLWRRGQRDYKKWNKACDYAINGILLKSGFTLPKGGLWDEAYNGMSAEEIYCILPPDPPQANGQSQPCEGGSGGGQEGDKGQSGGQGLGKGQGLNGDGTLDNHDYWDKSQKKDGNGKDGKDGEDGKSQGTAKDSNGEGIWHERLARAANQARLRGKMPADLETLVGGTLEPKLPWRDLLANFVQSSTRTNYRTMPPSKKYLHVPLYMPSLTGEFVEFAVAVDTSGSIADEELNQFISEIKNISENFEDYRVHIFACDADVHDIYEIESYDDWPTTYHGRGGTAFIPVFNAIAERGLNISCLLYLTDSYGTFPDVAPDYPVMWVINNPQGTAPWGEIVRLDVNEK